MIGIDESDTLDSIGAVRARRSSPQGLGDDAGTPQQGRFTPNQSVAYESARRAGFSGMAADAITAYLQGESLDNPSDYHFDRSHMASGAGQWDPERSRAIAGQFGSEPRDLPLDKQVEALAWEIGRNPAYGPTKIALSGNDPGAMMDALVRNYGRPQNPEDEIARRRSIMAGFEGQGGLAPARQSYEGARQSYEEARQSYEEALREDVPPPTVGQQHPEIQQAMEGYNHWRQNYNRSLLENQHPVFKALQLGIMGLGVALAARGGQSSLAALSGLTGFMSGLNEGVESRARRGLEAYKEGMHDLLEQYRIYDKGRSQIIQDRHSNAAQKRELLRMKASEVGDAKMQRALEDHSPSIDKINAERDKLAEGMRKSIKEAERIAREFEYLRGQPLQEEAMKAVNKFQKEYDKAQSELGKASSAAMKEAGNPAGEAAAQMTLQRVAQNVASIKRKLDGATADLVKGTGSYMEHQGKKREPDWRHIPRTREDGSIIVDLSGVPFTYAIDDVEKQQAYKAEIINQAKAGIAQGKNEFEVREHMFKLGVDPAELDHEEE